MQPDASGWRSRGKSRECGRDACRRVRYARPRRWRDARRPDETANSRAASGGSSRSYVAARWGVRRLTPTECARLQGFPDDWARIEWRGKPADQCPDGPQYKAYGNSMAVNVMVWIGERIAAVDAIT